MQLKKFNLLVSQAVSCGTSAAIHKTVIDCSNVLCSEPHSPRAKRGRWQLNCRESWLASHNTAYGWYSIWSTERRRTNGWTKNIIKGIEYLNETIADCRLRFVARYLEFRPNQNENTAFVSEAKKSKREEKVVIVETDVNERTGNKWI